MNLYVWGAFKRESMYFIVGAFSSVGVFINVFRAFSSVGMFMGHLPFRGTFFVFRALAVGGGGVCFCI